MSIAARLDAAVKAVCPIDGVRPFPPNDKSKWQIWFKDEATAQQRSAAAAVVTAFDVQTALNPTPDECGGVVIDSIDRLQFEVMFDMENRMRALEGLGAVTRNQYRTALVNRWKVLNP